MQYINETNLVVGAIAGQVQYPKHSLTVIAKATFDLRPGKVAKLCDADMQQPLCGDIFVNDDKNQALTYEDDFAFFKPKTDLLLNGTCHAPEAKPVALCRVSFSVGAFVKSLLVLGKREWLGGIANSRTGEPQAFTRMPLEYQYAPLYNKYVEQQVNWSMRDKISDQLPLPHVQPLTFGKTYTSQISYEPHGFAPLRRTWEQRMALLGRYSGDYLSERWPWFPKDFNWRYFNAAPEDQQLSGYLKGDEKLFFENLHPQHAQYYSQLPGLRVRCFLNEAENTLLNFREVEMNLDTLWVNMETEKLVLVWRGVENVSSQDHPEIQQIYLACEQSSSPAQNEQYYKNQLFAHLNPDDDTATTVLQRTAIPPIKSKADIVKEIDNADAAMIGQLQKVMTDVKTKLSGAGIDESLLEQLTTGDDPAAVAEEIFSGLGIDLAQCEQQVMDAQANIAKLLDENGYDGAAYLESLKTAELEQENDSDKLPKEPDKLDIQAKVKAGETLSGVDLSGIDLSGSDLSKAQFSNAILADANLSNCILCNTDFSGAVLKNAKLDNADLSGANLQDADLNSATLTGATLAKANIQSADFTQCDLANAVLVQCQGNQSVFRAAKLIKTDLSQADLSGADFEYATLDSTGFKRSNLTSAGFQYAQGRQVEFTGANLTDLKAGEGCVLPQSIFSKASANGAIFSQADLNGGNLSQAHFQNALFTGCNLGGCDMRGSDFSNANFQKADLTAAQAANSNFMKTSFEQAKLTKAVFTGSNLHEAEFLNAQLGNAQFTQAILSMTKLAGIK